VSGPPTVAILGGGQLGRMLALAGHPLGIGCRLLDPAPEACGGDVAPLVVGGFDGAAALDRLADGATAATFEWEGVPVAAVEHLARTLPVHPGPASLVAAQDRLAEKRLFADLGIPAAPSAPVDDAASLTAAIAVTGLPAILKTRRLGYDGKGQARVATAAEAESARVALGGGDLLLEARIPFDRELSLIAVRALDGTTATYPLVENEHRDGILHLSRLPTAPVAPALAARADAQARALLDRLGHVGVLTIELFAVGDALLANEIAPRVHNSGHWTIEGAETSQFENHLRAIVGLPLGSTAPRGASAMVNLVGTEPPPAAILEIPGAHLHRYGKEPRAGRKLGHVTVTAPDEASLSRRLAAVLETIGS